MGDLLVKIAQQLVDYPDQVRIKEIDGAHTIVFELSVAQKDLVKIIGARGRNSG